MTDRDSPSSDDSRVPVQPRNYLRPCLLLLLEEEPTYGYELRHKLAPLSAGNFDPGTVYRALNTMEDDGLVRSTWKRSVEGPRRRLYDITVAGSAVLDGLNRELCGLRTMVDDFIGRYESHHRPDTDVAAEDAVAVEPPAAPLPRADRVAAGTLVSAATNGHFAGRSIPRQRDERGEQLEG